jgi:hypothetical protein
MPKFLVTTEEIIRHSGIVEAANKDEAVQKADRVGEEHGLKCFDREHLGCTDHEATRATKKDIESKPDLDDLLETEAAE